VTGYYTFSEANQSIQRKMKNFEQNVFEINPSHPSLLITLRSSVNQNLRNRLDNFKFEVDEKTSKRKFFDDQLGEIWA